MFEDGNGFSKYQIRPAPSRTWRHKVTPVIPAKAWAAGLPGRARQPGCNCEEKDVNLLERRPIMITKMFLVINGMTGQETPVKVEEGATPADILKQLGLPNHQLARVKDRQLLRQNCDVSRVMRDGERLFAYAPIDVGGCS
jgi:sulfur carrier protein ThiS